MNSRIEQLIDELDEYIEDCKPGKFSKGMIMVNKEEIKELIHELRTKTPEEIKRVQRIIQQKEAILEDARQKAQTLITNATQQTTELVNESEIMQQAYGKANEVITMASRQAQEIMDNAATEANNMRQAAEQYTDDLLAYVEEVIANTVATAGADYNALLGNMKQYQDIIASNRRELARSVDTAMDAEVQADALEAGNTASMKDLDLI